MTATETIDSLFAPPPAPEPSADLTALAREYLMAREGADIARSNLKQAEEIRDAWEYKLLNALKAAGLKTMGLEDGPKLTAAVRHVFALPPKGEPEQRKAALLWLARVGGKDLIQRDVHHGSLGSFCRERLEVGKEITPLIAQTELTYIQVRKD